MFQLRYKLFPLFTVLCDLRYIPFCGCRENRKKQYSTADKTNVSDVLKCGHSYCKFKHISHCFWRYPFRYDDKKINRISIVNRNRIKLNACSFINLWIIDVSRLLYQSTIQPIIWNKIFKVWLYACII